MSGPFLSADPAQPASSSSPGRLPSLGENFWMMVLLTQLLKLRNPRMALSVLRHSRPRSGTAL